MTGLSGSGKTTIAQEVERRLCEKGVAAYMLDGDKLRRGLCGDLGLLLGDVELALLLGRHGGLHHIGLGLRLVGLLLEVGLL